MKNSHNGSSSNSRLFVPENGSDWWFSHQYVIVGGVAEGSTTALEQLQIVFGLIEYRYVYGGGMMRKKAGDEFINDFVIKNESDPSTDNDVDGRLSVYFSQNHAIGDFRRRDLAPRAFHVRVTCPEPRRVERYIEREFKKKKRVITPEQALSEINNRDSRDKARFKRLNPEWDDDQHPFHFTIDTSPQAPEETCRRIIEAHENWLSALPKGCIVWDAVPRFAGTEISPHEIPKYDFGNSPSLDRAPSRLSA